MSEIRRWTILGCQMWVKKSQYGTSEVIRLRVIDGGAWWCWSEMEQIPACLVSPQQLPLTSALLQGGALGVLAQLQLFVLGQLHQRGGLSLLVLFALAAIVAAVRLPLPLLLLLPTGGRRRLLRAVVDDILLLLECSGDNFS